MFTLRDDQERIAERGPSFLRHFLIALFLKVSPQR